MELSVGLLSQLVLFICWEFRGIKIRVHLPLNNRLQRLEIDEMDPESLSKERNKFETRWNYFNNIRTLIALALSFTLMLFIYAN